MNIPSLGATSKDLPFTRFKPLIRIYVKSYRALDAIEFSVSYAGFHEKPVSSKRRVSLPRENGTNGENSQTASVKMSAGALPMTERLSLNIEY